jgi:hypothetical protein
MLRLRLVKEIAISNGLQIKYNYENQFHRVEVLNIY